MMPTAGGQIKAFLKDEMDAHAVKGRNEYGVRGNIGTLGPLGRPNSRSVRKDYKGSSRGLLKGCYTSAVLNVEI